MTDPARPNYTVWPRAVNFTLGLWLMAAPTVVGYTGPGRTNDWAVGALAAASALVAIAAAANPLRWVNAALGVWLLVAPWYLGFGWSTMGHRMLVGVLMLSTALVTIRRPAAPSVV